MTEPYSVVLSPGGTLGAGEAFPPPAAAVAFCCTLVSVGGAEVSAIGSSGKSLYCTNENTFVAAKIVGKRQ